MADIQTLELLNYSKMPHASFDCFTFEKVIDDSLAHRISLSSYMFNWGKIEGMRTDKHYRIWMNKYNAKCFRDVCQIFDASKTKEIFSEITGVDYSLCRTRIELCKDEAGSWLHNHYDDKAKLFTLQLYLSDSLISTSFNKQNTSAKTGNGWFFANTARELHGLNPLPERRISLIVNYVDYTWRDNTVLV
jgi:hypothetical protein